MAAVPVVLSLDFFFLSAFDLQVFATCHEPASHIPREVVFRLFRGGGGGERGGDSSVETDGGKRQAKVQQRGRQGATRDDMFVLPMALYATL